jgi:hypothetical protein
MANPLVKYHLLLLTLHDLVRLQLHARFQTRMFFAHWGLHTVNLASQAKRDLSNC